MGCDCHVAFLLMIGSPHISCDGNTTFQLLKVLDHTILLNFIHVQDILPNSISSSNSKHRLQSSTEFTKAYMINKRERVFMDTYHQLKGFPCNILIKNVLFNTNFTISINSHSQCCLFEAFSNLPRLTRLKMVMQVCGHASVWFHF